MGEPEELLQGLKGLLVMYLDVTPRPSLIAVEIFMLPLCEMLIVDHVKVLGLNLRR